jgi:hypothetical protein
VQFILNPGGTGRSAYGTGRPVDDAVLSCQLKGLLAYIDQIIFGVQGG